MANTYVALAKSVLTSNALSVTFSSIPATYTDLYLVASARSDRALTTDNFLIKINGSTATTFTRTFLINNGTGTAVSSSGSNAFYVALYTSAASATADTFGSMEFYIPNYVGSAYKTASATSVQENNVTTGFASANALLWSDTSAIASMEICPSATQNWVSGSRFDLYGIKNT